MYISKLVGAIISILLISYGCHEYFTYFSGSPYAEKLTLVFMVGAFFMCLHSIRPGTTAKLTFFGSYTGKAWKSGYCLLPTISYFLDSIGLHFLWWLEKEPDEKEYRNQGLDNHHYADQREPSYRVNSDASLLTATTARIVGNIIGWITGFRKGDPDLIFQRLGFRLVVLSIVLGHLSLVPQKVQGFVDSLFGRGVFTSLQHRHLLPSNRVGQSR